MNARMGTLYLHGLESLSKCYCLAIVDAVDAGCQHTSEQISLYGGARHSNHVHNYLLWHPLILSVLVEERLVQVSLVAMVVSNLLLTKHILMDIYNYLQVILYSVNHIPLEWLRISVIIYRLYVLFAFPIHWALLQTTTHYKTPQLL